VDGVDGRHNTFNIIRRYDKTGILLSTLNVKNAICDPRLMGDGDADSASRLLASKDRVGWLTSGYEYIEFSLDGEIRDRLLGHTARDYGPVGLGDEPGQSDRAGYGEGQQQLRCGTGPADSYLDSTTNSWAQNARMGSNNRF